VDDDEILRRVGGGDVLGARHVDGGAMGRHGGARTQGKASSGAGGGRRAGSRDAVEGLGVGSLGCLQK
jgi:hypothetical protein